MFYWLSAIVVLVYLKFKEGRTKFFGIESAAGVRRREIREKKEKESTTSPSDSDEKALVSRSPSFDRTHTSPLVEVVSAS